MWESHRKEGKRTSSKRGSPMTPLPPPRRRHIKETPAQEEEKEEEEKEGAAIPVGNQGKD